MHTAEEISQLIARLLTTSVADTWKHKSKPVSVPQIDPELRAARRRRNRIKKAEGALLQWHTQLVTQATTDDMQKRLQKRIKGVRKYHIHLENLDLTSREQIQNALATTRSALKIATKDYQRLRKRNTRQDIRQITKKLLERRKINPNLIFKITSKRQHNPPITAVLQTDADGTQTLTSTLEECKAAVHADWQDYWQTKGARPEPENQPDTPNAPDQRTSREGARQQTLSRGERVNADKSQSHPPTMSEMKHAIKISSNGTAPGSDGVHNETLKRMPTVLHALFLKAIQISWQTKTTPAAWRHSNVFLIHKSGTRFRSTNYRPIALLSCMYKIYSSIIERKLRTLAENHGLLSNLQNGFRKGRSTTDSILILLQIMHHANVTDSQLIVELLDFCKAFDSAEHWAILETLENYGIDTEIVEVVRSLLAASVSEILVADSHTDPIHITRGVRQGDGLSPLLFLLFINPLLEQIQKSGLGYKVKDTCIPAQAFADDFGLITSTTQEARSLHELTVNFCQKNHLDINVLKSAIMIRKPPDEPFELKWKNQALPILRINETYKYLGVHMTVTGDTTQAWQEAVRKYKATVLFISRRCLTTRQRIILINKVAHAQIGYVIKHSLVPREILEELDAFTTDTLTSTLRVRTNTDADMWFVDWKLVSLRDLHDALLVSVLMDGILSNESSLAAQINCHLTEQGQQLPLLRQTSMRWQIRDTHAGCIPIQEIIPEHAVHFLSHVAEPWLPKVTKRTMAGHELLSKVQLNASFPRVPDPVWEQLRIRTCQPNTRTLLEGWTTPTLTPFHQLDEALTPENYTGREIGQAWVIYTDGSVKNQTDATSAVWISENCPLNISFRTWGEQTISNAELQAIEYTLRVTPRQKHLLIITDSAYAKTMCEREIKPNEWKHLPNGLTLRRIHKLLEQRTEASAHTKFEKIYSHIAVRLKGTNEPLIKRIQTHYNALVDKYGQSVTRDLVTGNEAVDKLADKMHPNRKHITLLTGGPRYQLLHSKVQLSKAPFKAAKQTLAEVRQRLWIGRKGRRSRHLTPGYDYKRTVRAITSDRIEDDSTANYMHKVLQGALNVRDVEYKIASNMKPENEHLGYMTAVYDSPNCAYCHTLDRTRVETFEHICRCPQHSTQRNDLWATIQQSVTDAGGDPNLLPTWFLCTTPNRPSRQTMKSACAELFAFDRFDGTLGFIPACLLNALQECNVPHELAARLTDNIAELVQQTARDMWRARCKTHSKEHQLLKQKTLATKKRLRERKRKYVEEIPGQANTLLRYLRPRLAPFVAVNETAATTSDTHALVPADLRTHIQTSNITDFSQQIRGRERGEDEREGGEEGPHKRRPPHNRVQDANSTTPLHPTSSSELPSDDLPPPPTSPSHSATTSITQATTTTKRRASTSLQPDGPTKKPKRQTQKKITSYQHHKNLTHRTLL